MMITIYQYLSGEQADEYSLVLTATGIAHRVFKSWSGWTLAVPVEDMARALDGIETYRRENPALPVPDTGGLTRPLHQASWCGVWGAAALLGVYLAMAQQGDLPAGFSALGASAAAILNGDWFRCATALLVHAGPIHLLGNMVGLAIFGSAVCGIAGPGVGMLMIAASGILGNLFNALLHQSHHLSVGASTAVFGAVGILVVYQIRHRVKQGDGWGWRTFLPLGAGLALLGFLSAGPRTDLTAHLLGMLAGGVIGGVYAVVGRRPAPPWAQAACTLVLLGIFAAAWLAAGEGI